MEVEWRSAKIKISIVPRIVFERRIEVHISIRTIDSLHAREMFGLLYTLRQEAMNI